MKKQSKKVLLVVLDGYGEGKDYKYNAAIRSHTPYLDQLRKSYPHTLLRCEGTFVGLPKSSMGGSEVGHFTIGAGRIVFQSLEEINRSIKSGQFFELHDLKKLAKHCKTKNKSLHLIGMISDQGIHAHIDHLFALLKFAKKENLKKVYIHAITDGRDVKEKSAQKFIRQINSQIKKLGLGKIATIVGRYYAMDRDKNIERTKQAFELLTKAKGTFEKSAIQGVKNEYARGTETDYYIKPIFLDQEGRIQKDDGIVFFNYRTDRAKQLTEMLINKGYKQFVAFGPYTKKAPVLFKANPVKNNLGEYLSKKGKKQLRVAETEKYAHVTYFFNSQKKEPNPGEKQILVPSSKVASYDLKPDMSAKAATKAVETHLSKYDFILLNYANGDLVGHSGNFKAVVKGLEAVDKCLKDLIPKALAANYEILLTADHGNAEFMKYPNGDDCPSHTLNPVIFMHISNNPHKLRHSKTLGLADVAPTVLALMGLKQPKEMTGKSLFI